MKKILIVTALSCIALSATSQTPPSERERDPMKMAEKRTEMMSKQLSLTEDQYSAVKQLNIDFAVERQKKSQGIQQLHQEYDKKLTLILSPEQMKKFNELKEEHREKRNDRKPPHGVE